MEKQLKLKIKGPIEILDFLAAFPAIVLWCVGNSEQASTSLADSSEHRRRNLFIHLIHRELDEGLGSGDGLRSL